MLFNIQKPSIFVRINSGTGSMEHPNSIIVRNKIEFERVDIFTSYIGSLESIIQRLHIVDIYFLSKFSYTFSWIQTKSLRQSVNKHSNWVKIKRWQLRRIALIQKMSSGYLLLIMLFFQESMVVRQRELVAHGFTQRPSNIPSWYM